MRKRLKEPSTRRHEPTVSFKDREKQRKISRYLSGPVWESQQKWTAVTSKAPRARYSSEANNRAVAAMARPGLKASDDVSDGHLLTQHSRIVASRAGYRLHKCTMTDIHWSKKTRDSIPLIVPLCFVPKLPSGCAAQPGPALLFLRSSKTNCVFRASR